MKRRVAHAVALLVIALACALAVLPARWLIGTLPAAWPFAIVDASGSIWSGSATLAIGQPGLRRTLPEPVTWSWRWSGGPHLVAHHAALAGELQLRPSGRGLSVSAQTLRLPASALTTLHATFGALNPDGEWVLRWPPLQISGSSVRAAQATQAPLLEVRWNNATSSLSRVRPMGSYRLLLTEADGGGIALALSTLTGPLTLQGVGTLHKGVVFDGTARVDANAAPETHAAFAELLNALGPRQEEHVVLRLRP